MTARVYHAWPRMMIRATAAAYCDLSVAEFEREVSGGVLPLPVKLGNREHWSRTAIDEALEVLTGERMPDWRSKQPFFQQFDP